MSYTTEAEDAMSKMRSKQNWLFAEAKHQDKLGNKDTAEHFYRVAKAATEIVDGLSLYVSRHPNATKMDLKELLQIIAHN
jgi:site-specific recombinase XerD